MAMADMERPHQGFVRKYSFCERSPGKKEDFRENRLACPLCSDESHNFAIGIYQCAFSWHNSLALEHGAMAARSSGIRSRPVDIEAERLRLAICKER
jgi:hypothetical protein